jgi:hypothetical protein
MKVEAFFQKNGQRAERVSGGEVNVKEGDTYFQLLKVANDLAVHFQKTYKIDLYAFHYIPHTECKEYYWDCENGAFSVIFR